MKAIYKKELRIYMSSMLGFVFIFFILLVCGIYYTFYNISYAYPEIGPTMSSAAIVLLIAAPILSMQTLAEEKKKKTDQLLLTSPVRVRDIVLGKFFALESIFLIPIAILCIYPLIMSQFGTITYSSNYTAIVGFFLLGSAELAIGIFASSLAENQIIAAVICFALLFLSNMIQNLSDLISTTASASFFILFLFILILCIWLYTMVKSAVVAATAAVAAEAVLILTYIFKSSVFEGAVQNLLEIFDLSSHTSNFINGIFDLTGVVYFLSVTVIFLFLAIQKMEKRRWS